MTNYLNLYLLVYVLNLIAIQYLVKIIFQNNVNLLSLPYIIQYILTFSKFRQPFFVLMLSLTGIPPFILFFIKFNYLIHLLSKISLIYLYFIVFIIFFNMIFYAQIFFIKNTNVLNRLVKIKKTKAKINLLLYIYAIIFFFITSIFFFIDMYFISLLVF